MRCLTSALVCLVVALALVAMVATAAEGRATPKKYSAERVFAVTEALQANDWRRSIFDGVERLANVTEDDDVPSQLKLAFLPGGMAVSFATKYPYAAPVVATVFYGLTRSQMPNTAQSASPGNTYGTLYFHDVLLENLVPATRYYYVVNGTHDVNSFVTARKPGDPTPFTALVVGDMGLANSANTMKQMYAELDNVDFFHHLGDASYADDFYLRPNSTYEGSWDNWSLLMEGITSQSPYMLLPGNHECTCTEVTPFLCPKNQQNFTAYRMRFRMPSVESGGVENLWHSYDYGLAHFVQISTETDFPNSPMGTGSYYGAGPFGDQLAWLEADLAAAVANRDQVPWIIVSGHRPLYSSASVHQNIPDAFEALFLQYNVDVYMAGHVHWYERMWPLGKNGAVTANNYDNAPGLIHLTNGAGGNIEGPETHAGGAQSAFHYQEDYGYSKLQIANATSARWQFMRATDGVVVDDLWFNKER